MSEAEHFRITPSSGQIRNLTPKLFFQTQDKFLLLLKRDDQCVAFVAVDVKREPGNISKRLAAFSGPKIASPAKGLVLLELPGQSATNKTQSQTH